MRFEGFRPRTFGAMGSGSGVHGTSSRMGFSVSVLDSVDIGLALFLRSLACLDSSFLTSGEAGRPARI